MLKRWRICFSTLINFKKACCSWIFSLQNKYDHESFIIALVPKRLKLIYLPLSTNYGAPQWALLQYIMDKVYFQSMRKTTKHLSFFLSFLPPSISFEKKKKIESKDFLCFFWWNVLLWSKLRLCRNAFRWEEKDEISL